MEIQYRHQLPELLKHFNLPLIAVEIGVAGGAFTEELLNNGIEFITCIDSWKSLEQDGDGSFPQEWHDNNYKEAFERLSKYPTSVSIIKGKSQDVHDMLLDGKTSLLYLDGDHSYEAVKTDLENYYPKVVEGGIIAGHDYPNYAGLTQAVEEFCKKHNKTIHLIPQIDPTNSSFWFRK